MWPNPQETALVTFTEEILNEKLRFLCSAGNNAVTQLFVSNCQTQQWIHKSSTHLRCSSFSIVDSWLTFAQRKVKSQSPVFLAYSPDLQINQDTLYKGLLDLSSLPSNVQSKEISLVQLAENKAETKQVQSSKRQSQMPKYQVTDLRLFSSLILSKFNGIN